MPNPPGLKVKHIPLNDGFARATNFEVRFDGGAFQLYVMEFRDSGEERSGPEVESWEMVELGRFAISPMALRRLISAAQSALQTYREAFGELPNDDKVTNVLRKAAERGRQKR